MDNVTHAALGLAIAQAASPSLGSAGLTLALVASELPDADIFFGMGNPWSMVTTHRGITHSVFLIPVAAAVLAGIWSRLSAAGSFWSFFWLAVACLSGHVLLDVLTTYGTQLLEPFSHHRFGWGWVPVIDPVVTVPLIAGAVVAWWIRGSHPAAARQVALAGLAAAVCYVLVGGIQSMPGRCTRSAVRRRPSVPRSRRMPALSSAPSSSIVWYTEMIIRSGWLGTTP